LITAETRPVFGNCKTTSLRRVAKWQSYPDIIIEPNSGWNSWLQNELHLLYRHPKFKQWNQTTGFLPYWHAGHIWSSLIGRRFITWLPLTITFGQMSVH
jgi:hypothetical protein